MKFTLAQCNFTVGDITGNVALILQRYQQAVASGADMLIVSEMAITGYPCEDMLLRPHFQDTAMQAAERLAASITSKTALLVGGVWRDEGRLYNTVFLIQHGKITAKQYKHHLPNYGVFDEKRLFAEGEFPSPIAWRGESLGVLICEDLWKEEVAAHLKSQGATLLIALNASPFEVGKENVRLAVARKRVQETGLPLLYVNQVGGQDELVFDGGSFALSATGQPLLRFPSFAEHTQTIDLGQAGHVAPDLSPEESIYQAMKMGLHDYVTKNHFNGVVLGLSGGIDSAISAAVAVDALGASKVHAVMLPSPYTSTESIEDATQCAQHLGIELHTLAIGDAMHAVASTMVPAFAGKAADITEENIQSRQRGVMLMALSNKHGWMVLTTGNKSEMAVGYATLYGDMCGGYNVLKDVYKTTVYSVSHWRNQQSLVIPPRILTKAPTAELRPNQTDQDSLPPYEVLDSILAHLIEGQASTDAIIALGFDPATVTRVAGLVARAEYKRRQAAPGVKITSMAFGRDRRYPLTNGWNN